MALAEIARAETLDRRAERLLFDALMTADAWKTLAIQLDGLRDRLPVLHGDETDIQALQCRKRGWYTSGAEELHVQLSGLADQFREFAGRIDSLLAAVDLDDQEACELLEAVGLGQIEFQQVALVTALPLAEQLAGRER